MRPARLVVPAAVAAAAWFASGALAGAGMASGSPRFFAITRLVAPDVVPRGAEAPGVWGPVVIVASALAVGGLFALGALLLRAGRGVAGFGAAWIAAVLAGTVVAGLPTVAELVLSAVGVPSPLPSVDSASDGANWGLVWGWIPALLLAKLAENENEQEAEPVDHEVARTGGAPESSVGGPPPIPTGPTWPTVPTPTAIRTHPSARARSAASSRTTAMAWSSVAALTGVVAFAVTGPFAETARHDAITAQMEADARAAEEAALSDDPPLPTPPPDAVPIPEIAPGDWRIDPTWCTENQLSFTASHPDAATGHRGMRVTATNVSSAPCIVDGYPDVAFSDRATNGFEVRVLHGWGMLGEPDAGAVSIELAPGGLAEADVTWDAQPRTEREPAGFLHIAAYPGAVRQLVPIDSDIAGGEVEVTAWRLPLEAVAAE
ncbi:DUF4232 domain-containing protein [Agromyces protaetiae]|uniref:DUF4232 domain-containing protein n=1 Tax=Agromyces protaetiae TaxID=2509455 RepID=A0A4P6FC11_9MICO|nr:DUF4232 domain-containing protein [Agromyces protaetiae]QAY73384.1 DUF4232 domain-containing protein [Agromyces protaetiae]